MTDEQERAEEERDAMLMAYVDGELPPESAAAVARSLAADPALAARAESFRRSRRLAREAFAGLLEAQPPERLLHGLKAPPASVVPFRRRLVSWPAALAASLLLVAALGGFLIGRQAGAPGGLLTPSATLLAALEGEASGRDLPLEEGTLRILASYPTEGGPCRSFTVTGEAEGWRALACRQADGWALVVASADPALAGGGFSPASDGAAGSLDAYLDALEAGAALTLEQERAALEQGWVAAGPGQ